MPTLDGTSILALVAFLGLVVAWVAAPSTSVSEAAPQVEPAAA